MSEEKPPRRCPICRRPATGPAWPFCSRRCRDVDLARWLGESYRIPDWEPPEWEEAEDAPSPRRGGDDEA